MPADYIGLVAEPVADGTRRYAAAARQLLREFMPETDGRIEDSVYLEPLLFAALSFEAPQQWLEQVTFGYLPAAARPERLHVTADREGLVHLPRLGSVVTRQLGGRMQLRLDATRGLDALRPHTLLRETMVELLPGGHPLLDRFYVDDRGRPARVRFAGLREAHAEHLDRALGVLANVRPRYTDLLLATLKAVVLHYGEQPNSFATPAAHGAVFLNMALGRDHVFLVEDLAHQGGHVLFSAASFDRARWFSVDPEVSLGNGDTRSIYIALHGVFTEAAMVDVLDGWSAAAALAEDQRHELTGRLAFALRRLVSDVGTLTQENFLSAEGMALLRALAQIARDVASRRPELLRVRLDNQLYNFSYERFAARNPLRATTEV